MEKFLSSRKSKIIFFVTIGLLIAVVITLVLAFTIGASSEHVQDPSTFKFITFYLEVK